MEDTVLGGRTKRDLMFKNEGIIFTARAAALIIKDNHLLAVKHADHDVYYTVGGGIEINETSEEAVTREVYEETGRRLEIDKLVFIEERFLEINKQRYHEIGFFYLMKNNADINVSESTHTDQEKETLHWLPLNQLSDIDLVPKFLKTKALNNISTLEHIISRE